jgi:hypothetical protein
MEVIPIVGAHLCVRPPGADTQVRPYQNRPSGRNLVSWGGGGKGGDKVAKQSFAGK